jgi:hypothetical protein
MGRAETAKFGEFLGGETIRFGDQQKMKKRRSGAVSKWGKGGRLTEGSYYSKNVTVVFSNKSLRKCRTTSTPRSHKTRPKK